MKCQQGAKTMNTTKNAIFIFSCIPFVLSAYSSYSAKTVLDTIAAESEMTITPSKAQVSEFEAQNKTYCSPFTDDACYNITPNFIANNSDFMIFKYEASNASFLLYDDEVYLIDDHMGGFGITSMALADLNKDGRYELYYTFSWGSGIHRSQIGYFDPKRRKFTVFDDAVPFSDIILTMDTDRNLYINSVTPDFYDHVSDVDFTIKAQEQIGAIVLEHNKIKAKLDSDILEQTIN